LPQYRKAVEKANAMEALFFVRAAAQGVKIYELSGNLPQSFEDLDIKLPGTTFDDYHVNLDRINISKKWYALLHIPSGTVSAYRMGAKNDEPKISYNNIGGRGMILCISKADNTDSINLCKSLGAVEANPPITYCGWYQGDSCLVLGNI
jgi:hypothetical protein